MSKKKFSGNTMTLKDFHGGSIPTDLPLPSAPGITVRASDRSGYDRPAPWGNALGRMDNRSRPHSSPSTRHFDDKTPFFTLAHIGRNFDEDERKPLDGVSAPRRTISDDSIQVPPTRVELKPEYGPGGSSLGRQPASVSQSSGGAVSLYSGRLTETIRMGGNSQNPGGGREQGSTGFHSNPQIGRDFDEDERKPLDSVSVSRRTISNESTWVPPSRVDLKPQHGFRETSSVRQVPSVSEPSGAMLNLYSGRLSEKIDAGVNSQNSGGGRERGTGYTNAWGMRKDVASVVQPEQQSAWSGPSAVSKLANASAVEKVSSGRWQSKANQYQTDIEVVSTSEGHGVVSSNVNGSSTCSRMDVVEEKELFDAMLARYAERVLDINDWIQGGRDELLDYGRSGSAKYLEVRERNTAHCAEGVQPGQEDSKLNGSELQQLKSSETSERPKLKLLPRTKPLESSEPTLSDHHTQGYRSVSHLGHAETANEMSRDINFSKPRPASTDSRMQGNRSLSHVSRSGYAEFANELPRNRNISKPGSASTDIVKQAVQRPKLNLKPRSQPLELLDGNTERDRSSLFGGARPRELVLKERGVDDIAINNYNLVDHSNWVDHNMIRTEKVPDQSVPTRHGEKTENVPLDQRTGKRAERKDQKADAERVNTQRSNWRGELRWNNRDAQRQQMPERPASPETWRKPEQPKPLSPDAAGLRYGKAASAVELAQAFSKRSVSDTKITDRFSGQKGLPGGNQIFSRLVGPTSRPQINGY